MTGIHGELVAINGVADRSTDEHASGPRIFIFRSSRRPTVSHAVLQEIPHIKMVDVDSAIAHRSRSVRRAGGDGCIAYDGDLHIHAALPRPSMNFKLL